VTHPLQLLLLLVIIIVVAKAAGAVSNKFGQPAVFGEIAVGLILGPTFLDMLGLPIFHEAVTHSASAPEHPSLLGVVTDLADIGVILLMFVAGMETDLERLRKVGGVALSAAVGGVALPMLGGVAVARAFGLGWAESVFVGTILTATSVSISAQTLMELKALRSKEGATIIGAAVIDDVLGVIVLSLVIAFSLVGGGGAKDVVVTVLAMAGFFVISIMLGMRYLERVTKWVCKVPASQALMAFVLAVIFLYAWAAEYLGQVAAITGAYIAGVLFARTKYREKIDESIHPITYSMFVPVFFVSIGLRANGRELGGAVMFTVLIVLVAIVAKILGCAGGARAAGFSNIESTRVGFGMVSRGEVGLIVASVGLTYGIIERDVFSMMIVMVLVTTMVTPLLLRRVFPKVEEVRVERVFESVAHVEDEKGKKGRSTGGRASGKGARKRET
jgi:Kef-type K+ transport system membrane component KefB